MRQHGQDWDAVIESPEYQADVIPLYEKFVWPYHATRYNCKTWPSDTCDCKDMSL